MAGQTFDPAGDPTDLDVHAERQQTGYGIADVKASVETVRPSDDTGS
jgi:hypothetical protein